MGMKKQEKSNVGRNRCKQANKDNSLVDDLDKPLVHNPILEAVKHLQKIAQGEPSALGLRTGFAFDEIIFGLQPGELFVLAACPSIGKTSLMLNIATNIALGKAHTPVGIFSFEMSTQRIIQRMLCSLTRIDLYEFRNGRVSGEQWGEVLKAASRIHDAPIVIDDMGEMDISELRTRARLMHKKYGVQVIFIDYLQLIQGTTPNCRIENDIRAISNSLKAMARELAIPVVVLVTLPRPMDCQEKASLSNLRDSWGIEQAADVIALLHRNRNEPLSRELIIAKNRHGVCGSVNLKFSPQYTLFENAPVSHKK